jgi:hypothetical protein
MKEEQKRKEKKGLTRSRRDAEKTGPSRTFPQISQMFADEKSSKIELLFCFSLSV